MGRVRLEADAVGRTARSRSRSARFTILPLAVRGKSSTISSRSGSLRLESPCGEEVRAEVGERRRRRGGVHADHGARDLAGGGIGHADDRDLGDGGMRGEQVLDLARADVLALADDDVLLAAR